MIALCAFIRNQNKFILMGADLKLFFLKDTTYMSLCFLEA